GDAAAGQCAQDPVLAEPVHGLDRSQSARNRAAPAGAVDAAPDAAGIVDRDEGGGIADAHEVGRAGQDLQLPVASVVEAAGDRAAVAHHHRGLYLLVAAVAGIGVVVAPGRAAQVGRRADVDAAPAVRVAAHQQGAVVADREQAAVVVGDVVQVLGRG